MREFFYTLGIQFYGFAVRIATVFNSKARKFISGRKKSRAALHKKSKNSKTTIWFHCASLGEFEQGRPIIDYFKENYQNLELVLTFYSPSGYEIRKDYPNVDFTCYLLQDTPSNMRLMVEKIDPDLVVVVKYEFWHHFLKTLQSKNVPVISISAKFRSSQHFFSSSNNFFNQMLRKFDHIFTQDDESKKLLKGINISNVTVAGDTRYDRVVSMSRETYSNRALEQFSSLKPVMVIGSCWPADLEILYSFIQKYCQEQNFLIAPHELKENSYKMIEDHFPDICVRYSQITDETDLSLYSIIILDVMGQLSYMYRFGKFAFVGGGFGKGLHNILEPACYGLPVFFGNRNYQKFNEANDLIRIAGAHAVSNTSELIESFKPLLENNNYQTISDTIRHFVKHQEGASSAINTYIEQLPKLK